MSENEHEAPQLTRRQLRELRNTASNPIITGDEATAAPPPEPESAPVAPLPREAEPVVIPDPPTPEASIDLGSPALTRRQARYQEKIRTASIPIIAPDAAPREEHPADDDAVVVAEELSDDESSDEVATSDDLIDGFPGAASAGSDGDDAEAPSTERHVVSEELGAALLSGSSAPIEPPTSFDQLLSRSAAVTGAFTAPSALILSQTPDGGPLVAPVTATGEVLITGTFSLPDRFGSTGVVPGSADGAEVDAVLIDGELPASSSPTPIAASAAISTIKSAEDVIRPPAPEKGSRLMISLAITAGVLAFALAGVLIVALVTGVFQ